MGHEISGVVAEVGDGVDAEWLGARVVTETYFSTCGTCEWCASGRENLCRDARFTGFTIDGGYADYTVADARYAFKIPDGYADVDAAPLLCAGLIGYRSYRIAGTGRLNR